MDDRICSAICGFNADGRVLVNKARYECQVYSFTYDQPVSIEYISKRISEIMQKFTQRGGARPFGFSLMLAGIGQSGQPILNQIDPSGMITTYKSHSIGKNSKFVNEMLEEQWKEDMSLEEGLDLMARCFNNNIDDPKNNSEIVVVGKDQIKFLQK